MTERTAHHHPRPSHHHHRPPDVNEALSSMLWTPYERTPTDSSSEDDDDERLNKQLRKSSSSYDYRGVVLPPVPFVPLSSSYFGAADNDDDVRDLMLPTAATVTGDAVDREMPLQAASPPLVPLSNLIFNINGGHGSCLDTTTITSADVAADPNVASIMSAATTPANYQKSYDTSASHFRFSYPYYGPIPSLNKWWSASAKTTSSAKEPPSYESLYSKTSTIRSTGSLRPVLHSLKATVSTITSSPDRQPMEYCDSNQSSQAADGFSGGIVHSFTDDFISKKYSETELPTQSSQTRNSNQQPTALQHVATTANVDNQRQDIMQFRCQDSTTTQELKQKQQQYRCRQPDENRQQLTDLEPLPAEEVDKLFTANARSQQNKENNNNNCTSSNHKNHLKQQQQQQQLRQQLLPCAKEAKEENEETPINRAQHQVNQPAASVERCSGAHCATTAPAMNSRSSNSTTSAAAINSFSTTFPTTPMNSTMLETSDKATKPNCDTSHSQQQQRRRPAADDDVSVHADDAQPTTISPPSSFDECTSPLSVCSLVTLSAPYSSFKPPPPSRINFESCLHTATTCTAAAVAQASSSSALTPNKCLAELERLYAEFRASESLVTPRRHADVSNFRGDLASDKMRLSIPAAAVAATAGRLMDVVPPDSQALKLVSASPTTTSSSVFLTTTNSVTTNNNASSNNNSFINNNNNSNNNGVAILSTSTTIANPCQRQPSLTIQVNNNDHNNINNNNNVVNTKQSKSRDLMLNQSIVNNNGVSVVNCSYVQASNNNNTNCTGNFGVSAGDGDGVGVTSSASSSVNVNNSSPVPKVFSNNCAKNSADSVASNSLNNNNINNNKSVAATIHSAVNIINVNTQSRNELAATPATTSLSLPTTPIEASASATTSPTSTPSRTFTSTECQTDDIATVQLRTNRIGAAAETTQHNSSASASSQAAASSREQRRRERRERRHQQQQTNSHNMPPPPPPPPNHRRHSERHSLPIAPMTHLHPPHMHHASLAAPHATMPAGMSAMLRPMLPDILHSHYPPPYSALPLNGIVGGGGRNSGPPPPQPHSIMRPLPPPPPPPPNGTALLTSVITAVPIPGGTPILNDGRFTLPLPIIRRSPSERSGKGCCGQWFAGPPLRALIAVVALGGVACALGGAALGATGLAGPPSSHLTAALLMIGVGVVLVTVSGAAWRMTAPGGPPCLGLGSSVDLGRCGRRPCSRGGGAPHGLLYPEFQHRPPPPSYQASMQEYRLRLLLLDRDRQNGVVRGNSPPPTYRSHAGSLLRAPLTTTSRGGGGASSIGGSEYSLPPSYRSRNHTPATVAVCSERSIETAPSGRLLANEDIPEPLSVAEQLADYSALQLHLQRTSSNRPSTPKTRTTAAAAAARGNSSAAPIQLRTSAIVEVEAAVGGNDDANAKLNPRVFGSATKETYSSAASASNCKDLVTIVTISQEASDSERSASEARTSGGGEQIEILAHL